jgi:hypothetical protein
MIELTFLDFHGQQYSEQQFCLYVVKNASEDILYVGISVNNIWERWFGWGGHMLWDGNVIYGESPIGMKIEDHLPDSLKWKIQLWNLKDCLEFCTEELLADTETITIHDLEPIIIRKFSPALNGTHNINPGNDTTSKSKREIERRDALNQAYKEIFDKKQT